MTNYGFDESEMEKYQMNKFRERTYPYLRGGRLFVSCERECWPNRKWSIGNTPANRRQNVLNN